MQRKENEVSLILRLAERKDCRVLFDWRNEESVRRQSVNTDPISWLTHVEWFNKSLSNPNRQIYLAEVSGKAVGMIRADLEEGRYELSWLISTKFRRKGYGRQMLSQIIDSLSGSLYARIKTGNAPSLAMVELLGFRRVSPEDAPLTEWVLEK
jgi:RimJ/RimL family protein N-acetyltransferase